jgi:hypothetical protein
MGGSGGSWQCMLQAATGASLLCFPLICVAFKTRSRAKEFRTRRWRKTPKAPSHLFPL